MLSLAVFLWFQVPMMPAGEGNLPDFNRFTPCSFVAEQTGADIAYPSQCPQVWAPVGPICFPSGGYYAVNLQLGMVPGTAGEGDVRMESQTPPMGFPSPPDAYGNSQFVVAFKVRPDAWTLNGNSVVLKADAGECFRLKYRSSAPFTINTDARASRLTIYRLP